MSDSGMNWSALFLLLGGGAAFYALATSESAADVSPSDKYSRGVTKATLQRRYPEILFGEDKGPKHRRMVWAQFGASKDDREYAGDWSLLLAHMDRLAAGTERRMVLS